MIERYIKPELKKIWSQENIYHKWFEIEVCYLNLLEEDGIAPAGCSQRIREKVKKINGERICELEKELKHDIIAFIAYMEEQAGEDAKFLHYGLTSYDIVDTAYGLILKEAGREILFQIDRVLFLLKKLSLKYKNTIMVGRTHGIHAQPITFGLVLSLWFDELRRGKERFVSSLNEVEVGKFSGAVGTYSNSSIKREKKILQKLGLKSAPVSNQIIQRDNHANFINSIALIGCSIEKFATQIRHLQRSEIGEVFEPFYEKQRGSSAMPHKRNPVLCENICGLARLLRGYVLSSMENIPLWHERDISHSSVERVILPDATSLIHFILHRFSEILEGLVVDEKRMKKNLKLTRGLIFSENLMLMLIEKGMQRSSAYKIVQKNAMEAVKKRKNFKKIILKDEKITSLLTRDEIERAFSLKNALRNVNKIIKRALK